MKNSNNEKTPSTLEPAADNGDVGKKLYWGGAALSFLFSFTLYVKTLSASASFWDAGEFIAAAYSLGIPHSPGTPLYVLVGRVFTELPLPFFSIAERVNLLSAFCGAVGVFFVYVLVVRFLQFIFGKSETTADTLTKVVGGLVAALFLTVSDTYWINAIEAEVYAMSTALMGFMTWLTIKWGDRPLEARSTFLIYLLFYLLALSAGFHLGTILVFSGIFFFVWMTKNKPFSNLDFVIACVSVAIFAADATLYRNGKLTVYLLIAFVIVIFWLYSKKRTLPAIATVLFVLGLSVHLYLKIRSGLNPSLDEADPETWRNLYAVLRREQYPPMNAFDRKADFFFQITHFSGYFQSQFQMASAYIGKLNLGSLIPIGLGVWGMVDQFGKHRKSFVMLFVTLVVVSLGLIVFLNFSDSEVRERDYFYSPAFYYFAIYIGIGAASLLGEIKHLFRRKKTMILPALGVGAAILISLPMFTLKHHYNSHDRSNDYLCPVYARNMLVALEKDAIIFTNGDNDTFPLWYIQEVEGYRTDVKVVNLSLLNTPWYIKQCRDNEPKVPIAWTDNEIGLLRPVRTSTGVATVRDRAVYHILKTNKLKRPIYFAVTIPPSTYAPYRDYLEMQGLYYLVVPRKGENMTNVPKLRENVRENYKYTGILDEDWKRDESLYKAPYVTNLIRNYSAAFAHLGALQHRDSLFAEAAQNMEIALEITPDRKEPIQLLGWYYLDAGDTTEAVEFYKKQIRINPDDIELKIRLTAVYERIGQVDKALAILDGILAANPEDKDVFTAAVGVALRAGLLQRARTYLAEWSRRHPGDASVRQAMEELDQEIRNGASNPE